MAFEQLMAEATAKREKKSDPKKEDKEPKKHRSMFGHSGEEKSSSTSAS